MINEDSEMPEIDSSESLEAEISRGVQARQLMEHPLFVEAIDKTQQGIFDRFAAIDPSDLAGLQTQRLLLKCLADVTRQIQTVMETGLLAKAEVDRRQSLAARVVERMKHGIRSVI